MLGKLKEAFQSKQSSGSVPTRAVTLHDLIAPPSVQINQNSVDLRGRLTRSLFVFSYPRYLSVGWLAPIINMSRPISISFFFHPVETTPILKKLRKKTTEIQAELMEREDKGLVRDPELETAFQDIEDLRNKLRTAQEKMFQLGIYFAISGDEEKELRDAEIEIRSILESRLVYIKPASFQQKEGFYTCAPYGLDELMVNTPMNTSPLSSVFPFISFDLSSNEGILYGVNKHNNSLVLFDRFSLENANMVIFGKSGGGKSYATKLEILRLMMEGVDVLIIDPENEYEFLSDAADGSYINISLSSPHHLNPFALPKVGLDENPADVLRRNTVELVGLFRIMLGGLTPEEDSIIDQAIIETYASKDITAETNLSRAEAPLMNDFQAVLESMEGAESLSQRTRKFTLGSYANFFNNPTNVEIDRHLVVFGIRDMEDELRPMAMYIILHHIWNEIRGEMKKRVVVIDEAWVIMQSPDGASFLFGMAKRARKYWLGLTTITQDVNDFLSSPYGVPILNNSSLQLLMKQSSTSVDVIANTFGLTMGEKHLILSSSVGEGLFFAGNKRVAIQVVASYTEDQIITSNPEEVVKIKEAKRALKKAEFIRGNY
jgi:conjugal transfer ATP-binding protein TraC